MADLDTLSCRSRVNPRSGGSTHPTNKRPTNVALLERRLELQVIEPVHRLDVDPLHRIALQHVERDAGPGIALRPDLSIELGQRRRLLAIDADDHVAAR